MGCTKESVAIHVKIRLLLKTSRDHRIRRTNGRLLTMKGKFLRHFLSASCSLAVMIGLILTGNLQLLKTSADGLIAAATYMTGANGSTDTFPAGLMDRIQKMTDYAQTGSIQSNLSCYHPAEGAINQNAAGTEDFAQVDGTSYSGNVNWVLTIDLKQSQTIGVIDIQKYDATNPSNYKVEISADSQSWSQVGGEVTGDTRGDKDSYKYATTYFVINQPQLTRYVRVTMNGVGNWSALEEIGVLGDDELSGADMVNAIVTHEKPASLAAPDTLVNLAGSAKVSSNLLLYSGGAASNLVDGRLNDFTQINGSQFMQGQKINWVLDLDLGHDKSFDYIVMYKYDQSNPKNYTIYFASDPGEGNDKVWHQLGAATTGDNMGNGSTELNTPIYFIPSASQTARYIKIVMNDVSSWCDLAEFKLCSMAAPVINYPGGDWLAGNEWENPVIAPIPDSEQGVGTPKVLLDGIWKFAPYADEEGQFWDTNYTMTPDWVNATVPGDATVTGLLDYNNSKGKMSAYRTTVNIPTDFGNSKILLRFEGGYDYARVWVNGHYVRDHYGAYTTWDCDITPYVQAGHQAVIAVGLTPKDETVDAVEYRHNRGLIRDVSLIAVPKTHVSSFQYATDFDKNYQNATLSVTAKMEFQQQSNATVQLSLNDPSGKAVSISPSTMALSTANSDVKVDIPVSSPQKWDDEHPYLYILTATVIVGGQTVEILKKNVGFRKIEIDGNVMKVNGNIVKLHGVNWHQNDPVLGEVPNKERDDQTIKMLKDANVNFIRTSHYPQTEDFYDMCDKLGIYVDSEASIFFIDGQGVAPKTENDPAYKAYYVVQATEMVEKEKSHPSIVMWSTGNESTWGTNDDAVYAAVRAADPTRPTIYSYPSTNAKYEISSCHYPSQDYSFGQKSKPELFDEYSHNNIVSDADTGSSDWYGEQIQYWWNTIYYSKGSLGGAIWCAQDTNLSGGGMDEWGLIDAWNRPKPELYNVKQAYSPIVLNDNSKYVLDYAYGTSLKIPVENRFNETNLKEVVFTWSVNGKSGTATGIDLAPTQKGTLTIPYTDWKLGDVVTVSVTRPTLNGMENINTFSFTVGGKKSYEFEGPQGDAPTVSNNTVSGKDFSIQFDSDTGLIKQGTYKGKLLLKGGPYLDLGATANLGSWALTSPVRYSTEGNQVIVNIDGSYSSGVNVDFELHIDGTGMIQTKYMIKGSTPTSALELGVAYDVTADSDQIHYARDGVWTSYPNDYPAQNEGTVVRTRDPVLYPGQPVFQTKPEWPYEMDMVNYKYFLTPKQNIPAATATNEFKASINDVYYASLINSKTGNRLRYEGDGYGSCRASVNADGTVRFNMSNEGTKYSNTDLNLNKEIFQTNNYTNTIQMRMADNDTVQTTCLGSDFVTIKSVATNGYLSSGANGMNPLVANKNTVSNSELFQIVGYYNGNIAIRPKVGGYYLAMGSSGSIRADNPYISNDEMFVLQKQSNGTYTIKAAYNQNYLSATSSGVARSVSASADAQKFLITSYSNVNKLVLNAAVNSANARNQNHYTAASWNNLAGALSSANAALNDQNASQDEVDNAVRALESAVNALVLKSPSSQPGSSGGKGSTQQGGQSLIPDTGDTGALPWLLMALCAGCIAAFTNKRLLSRLKKKKDI